MIGQHKKLKRLATRTPQKKTTKTGVIQAILYQKLSKHMYICSLMRIKIRNQKYAQVTLAYFGYPVYALFFSSSQRFSVRLYHQSFVGELMCVFVYSVVFVLFVFALFLVYPKVLWLVHFWISPSVLMFSNVV